MPTTKIENRNNKKLKLKKLYIWFVLFDILFIAAVSIYLNPAIIHQFAKIAAELRPQLTSLLPPKTELPNKRIIGKTSDIFEFDLSNPREISSELQTELELSDIYKDENLKATIRLVDWTQDKEVTESQVFEFEEIEGKKQEVIKLKSGQRFLFISNNGLTNSAQDNEQNIYYIAAGLKPNIISQGSLLAKRILEKDKNALITFLELKGQGLTHVQQKDEQVTGPSIYSIEDPFTEYETDFRAITKYLTEKYTDSKITAFALSTSSMPLLRVALDDQYKDRFKKLIFNGFYTGTSTRKTLLQNFAWFISPVIGFQSGNGFYFSPMAMPLKFIEDATSQDKKALKERIAEFTEIKDQKAKDKRSLNPLHWLHETALVKLGLQYEVPITWTDSANKYFIDLYNFIKTKDKENIPEVKFIHGTRDDVADLPKANHIIEELLEKRVQIYSGDYAFHNGFQYYSEYLANLAFQENQQ